MSIESCHIWLLILINFVLKKKYELVAKGEDLIHTHLIICFCNKICGAHYNMQMKIIVDTPEDYKNGF
jgi:cytochrome c oxidase subunit 2